MEEIEGDGYEYESKFKKIPFQEKMHIFLFFSTKSRQMIRGVCSEFKEMVDAMPCAVVNNENYQRTTQLTDVFIVKVQNFTNEFQSDVMFKHSIRRFEFWDIVISYNLFHLLQECRGVQELNFGNVILDSHKKMKCPEGLSLPLVKVVTFRTKHRIYFSVHEFILFDFLRQIKFETLEQVLLQWSIDAYKWEDRNDDMEIEMKCPSLEPQLPSGIKLTGLLELLLENRQTVKTFKADSYSFYSCRVSEFGSPTIVEIEEQIDTLQFEEFQCDVNWIAGNETQVLERQKHLKEIKFLILSDCWSALARAIQGSASTLTKATIEFQYILERHPMLAPTDWEHKDASAFKHCTSLESLCWRTLIPIFNLVELPNSIRSLVLDAPFNQEDLLAIAAKLRNLQEVSLTHSRVNNKGPIISVNNEIIQAFVGIETLEKLSAWGFNVDSAEISDIANSQNVFDISYHLPFPQYLHFGHLEISEVLLTPSEPST